jgi:hypothetical protein
LGRETYRNVRKEKFTQVGNNLLWDSSATLEAKGLMSIFLSNSATWDLNMKEIIKRSKNGRDKHYTVVDELIEMGYFSRVEIRKGGKFVEIIYIFSDDKEEVQEALEEYRLRDDAFINRSKKKKKATKESTPFPENPDTVPFPENPDTVKPETAEPNTAEPFPVSQDINNKNLNNTNSNNTNSNNTNQSFSLCIDSLWEEGELPKRIVMVMQKNLDRLTEHNIHPLTIETFYNVFTEHKLSGNDFAYVLEKVLTQTTGKINSFPAVMKKAAKNFYDEYE